MSQFRPFAGTFISPAAADAQPLWPYYAAPYINMSSLTGFVRDAALGESWTLAGSISQAGGNSFRLVKANAGLAVGQLVAFDTPVADTVAAPLSLSVITLAGGGLTVQAEVGNLVHINVTGGTPIIRVIKANTATTLTVSQTDYNVATMPADKDVLPLLPTAGDVVTIIRPWNVIVCTATLTPCGVALGTVTSGNYTIIQTGGIGQVLTVGSVVATVVGAQAAPGAAGVVTGYAGTVAGLVGAAAPLYGAGCRIIACKAYAGASALQLYDLHFN